MIDLEELKEQRRLYQEAVDVAERKRGREPLDIAMRAEGMRFVLDVLSQRWSGAAGRAGPCEQAVLEMGMGYSTVVLTQWCASHQPSTLVSADHLLEWLVFVQTMLPRYKSEPWWKRLTCDRLRAERHLGRYDLILVDHGPKMTTRIDDMPWMVRALKEDGVMVFDDWRHGNPGRVTKALAALPGSWRIEVAEHTCCGPLGKAVALATRCALATREAAAATKQGGR